MSKDYADIDTYSLKDKIIKTINENQYVSAEAKNQLLDLFVNGVKLDLDIFSQKRVKEAEVQKSIKFCPTYLVTGCIFRHIME